MQHGTMLNDLGVWELNERTMQRHLCAGCTTYNKLIVLMKRVF